MAAIGSVSGGASSVPVQDAAAAVVAAKGLEQMKQDGANAVALIQAAKVPPTGDQRGQIVNIVA